MKTSIARQDRRGEIPVGRPAGEGADRPAARDTAGVTLVELAVVIFLIGIAFLASFPFLKQAFQSAQSGGSGREIFTDLAMARAMAIKEQRPFLVESCSDPPGYMIMRCNDRDPDGIPGPGPGDFTTAPCGTGTTIDVCAALSSDQQYAGANANAVVRQVNLGGGKSSVGGSALRLARVRFGLTGGVTTQSPYTEDLLLPADGIQLADCDSAATPRKFYFHWRGRTQKYADNTRTQPCRGALYLTGRMSTDPMANRAVEFTTVGSLRIYRWDSTDGRWE